MAAPPNMRMQRTRSSPSALRSPLMRCPLGGGSPLPLFGRPSLLKLPAHPVGRVADLNIAFARAAVQAWNDRFASLLRCRSIRHWHQKPAPTRGTAVAVSAVHPRARGYCFLQLPSLGNAWVVAIFLRLPAERAVEATQHRITCLRRTRVLRNRHRHVTTARQLRMAKGTVGIDGSRRRSRSGLEA